jgi:hypothetical protein
MFAFKHSAKTFVVLIKYLSNDLHLSYVLTGKFQTDCLEARFGMYRRMSGKNELVTAHELTVEIEDEQFDYLRGLDRGGLKWPTELLVEVVTQVFYVFNCLISSKYESKFLHKLATSQ